jgi:hypothetical protein
MLSPESLFVACTRVILRKQCAIDPILSYFILIYELKANALILGAETELYSFSQAI